MNKWSKLVMSSGHSDENKTRQKFNQRNIVPVKNSRSTVFCPLNTLMRPLLECTFAGGTLLAWLFFSPSTEEAFSLSAQELHAKVQAEDVLYVTDFMPAFDSVIKLLLLISTCVFFSLKKSLVGYVACVKKVYMYVMIKTQSFVRLLCTSHYYPYTMRNSKIYLLKL